MKLFFALVLACVPAAFSAADAAAAEPKAEAKQPTSADLEARLKLANRQLEAMRMRYRTAHPQVQAQLKLIAELQRQIAARE
jgi:hypothetical protein